MYFYKRYIPSCLILLHVHSCTFIRHWCSTRLCTCPFGDFCWCVSFSFAQVQINVLECQLVVLTFWVVWERQSCVQRPPSTIRPSNMTVSDPISEIMTNEIATLLNKTSCLVVQLSLAVDCGDVAVYKLTKLAHFFSSVLLLVSIFVFMALSTVFYSINSPPNSPPSHAVFPVLFLPYCTFQLYISSRKSS